MCHGVCVRVSLNQRAISQSHLLVLRLVRKALRAAGWRSLADPAVQTDAGCCAAAWRREIVRHSPRSTIAMSGLC